MFEYKNRKYIFIWYFLMKRDCFDKSMVNGSREKLFRSCIEYTTWKELCLLIHTLYTKKTRTAFSKKKTSKLEADDKKISFRHEITTVAFLCKHF